MAKSIQERVRAAQAKATKEREALEHKAGESARRSDAARMAAQTRKDNRIDSLIRGEVSPRNRAEAEIMDRFEDL